MNRDQAMVIVKKYLKSQNLINHSLAVEAAMRFYAKKLNQDEELWGITGLLHDFDWEIHPTMEEHPLAGEPILRENDVPEEVIQAILSHADHTGLKRETTLQKALFAVDELTGLITAVALVRPSKSIHDLKPKSVKNKWKVKTFAAGANREDIENGARDFGVELFPDHVQNVIDAMKTVADEIGLAGILQQE